MGLGSFCGAGGCACGAGDFDASSKGVSNGACRVGSNSTRDPGCSNCLARRKLYLLLVMWAISARLRTMVGLMNTIRLFLVASLLVLRNRLPSTGRSPSRGTFCSVV